MSKEQELRDSMADTIRSKKMDMFAERTTVDEVIQEYQLKGNEVVAIMVMMNTLLESIAEGIENGRIG